MQSHLYDLGLLQGRCSDIRIRAFGRIYHLHRLLLIQSGFFRAMLCGGYAEDLAVSSAAAGLSKSHSAPDPTSSSGRGSSSSTANNHHENSSSSNNNNNNINDSNNRVDDSSARNNSLRRNADADIIDLRFDDPNISRAAFEYCIAKLYGGGPTLVLPSWSSPSRAHPFSPALMTRFDSMSPECPVQDYVVDENSHPATPRFLLSLIATSIYLNIPSITSQALTLVLCSVTPYTVTPYLRFAIGKGIEGSEVHRPPFDTTQHNLDEWDWELEGPTRTLEKLARPDVSSLPGDRLPRSTSMASPMADDQQMKRNRSKAGDFASDFFSKLDLSPSLSASSRRSGEAMNDHDARDLSSPLRNRTGASVGATAFSDVEDPDYRSGSFEECYTPAQSPGKSKQQLSKKTAGFSERPRHEPTHENVDKAPEYHYGPAADKIGEACVCWYARWGSEIFPYETALENERVDEVEAWIKACRRFRNVHRLIMLRDRLQSGEVDLLHTSMLPRGRMPGGEESLRLPRLRVWSYPSMPSSWVRAIISSDSFFVPSEWKRYEFAKRVVDFRRRQKALIQVLDRLIEQLTQEDLASEKSSSSQKAGGKASSTSALPSFDAESGFGFKGFGRASTATVESDGESGPLQDVWNDETASSTFQDPYDEDEAEYNQLFSTGIYYSHMPFQELNRISSDVSPITGRPYTPIHVLQAALWVSNELRNHILSSTPVVRGSSNAALDHEAEDASANVSGSQDGNAASSESESAGELGVSSSLAEFRLAFESSISSSMLASRFPRSRSGTPMSAAGSLPDVGLPELIGGLGGIAESPLLFGSSGGRSALLNKRYFLVPSDDTVRFGDGLLSVMGMATTAASSSRQQGGSSVVSPFEVEGDDLGPSGHAATQIPHTVPISTLSHYHDSGSMSHVRKDRGHYYGIANDVATGRELGESAFREMHSPSLAASPYGHRADAGITSSPREIGQQKADDLESGDASSSSSTSTPLERWSGFEPMRIGVEFFGIEKLPEKQRLYSPTFFYAGSIWNLYIQVVKKAKGVQLGIYLHRQSPNENLPPPSAPATSEVEVAANHTNSLLNFRDATQRRQPQHPQKTGRASTGLRARTDPSSDGARAPGGSNPSQRTRSPDVQPTQTSGRSTGEGNSSFFDSSFTPVRSGHHAVNDQTPSSSSSLGIGSTITLPSGQSITQMMGQAGSTFLSGSASSPTEEGSSSNPLPSLSSFSSSFATSTESSDPISAGASATTPTSAAGSGNDGRPNPHVVPLFPGGPSVYQTYPTPQIPYRDPRKELRAYFSIHCPSPLGNALTKFSSGPDKFTISQSWGWKSSSLLGGVYLENGELEGGGKSGFWPRFRCVCTIGVV